MAWAERARRTARQKVLDAARKFSDTKYKISLISGRLDCSPVASATSFNMGIQHEALYCEEGSLGMRTLSAFWRRVAGGEADDSDRIPDRDKVRHALLYVF